MTCVARLTVIASIGGLLAARSASAQVMCNDAALLPNPTVVTGSLTFEQLIGQLAVKLAAEPTPTSVIFALGDPTACTGIASVANGADLGGTAGRYYTLSGSSVTNNDCTFAAGQKADVAVSDVFYESCSILPQPRPAEIVDVTGPVQATVFIVPTMVTTPYLSYQEAQAIFGCGVSPTRPIAGFSDPTSVFCRSPSAGPQIALATNLGLSPTALTDPRCVNGGSSIGAIAGNVSTIPQSISFITADGLEVARKT